MNIIVWEDKHGTSYYDASTPENREASAREILRQLIDQQYIYKPDDEPDVYGIDMELVALTEDQVDALPTNSMAAEARKHRKTYAARVRENDDAKREYETIQEILAGETVYRRWTRQTDSRDGKFKAGQRMKAPITAWSMVSARSDYEYEQFSEETVWVPGEDDE